MSQKKCDKLTQIICALTTHNCIAKHMSEQSSYYIEKLKGHYQARLRKNPSYSLRAFSSYLGLAPQVISSVFKGQRHLPVKSSEQVIDRLGLSVDEARLFMKDLKSRKAKLSRLSKNAEEENSEITLSEERHFRIIAEWEYYAILNLLDTKDEFSQPQQMARRLGLSEKRAQFLVEDLIAEEMIEKNQEGFYQRKVKHLTTTKDVPSQALKHAHKEALQLAGEKLTQVNVDERFYSASTISIDKFKLNAAKDLLREFRKKMTMFMKEGETDEVYQFNIQLFPLTQTSVSPQEKK